MNNNSKILLEKLNILSKEGGGIVFAIGDYYVQFVKNHDQDKIYFEAVSHNFLDILPKNLSIEFSKLSFQIDDTNYYKWVDLNCIETIISDVQKIFVDIYKINYDKEFEIMDDIQYSNKSNRTIQNIETSFEKIHTKTNPVKTFFIIGGILLLAYWIFTANDKKKTGDLKSEACIISQEFVERQLLSPKSADFGFCDDSKIIHLGNNRYQVKNYVDASNAFGASLRKTYLVIIRYNKGEWEDINNWTLETIAIE